MGAPSQTWHNATHIRQTQQGATMKASYPYTPRHLQDSRSEFAANLQLSNLASKHRAKPRYIQRAIKHNHVISRALPWILLLVCMVAGGVMLAWRG